MLPRSRRKSSKGRGRPADRFSFLALSKVLGGWRAAGSLGIGKSPLCLQWSKPISQLPASRMAVGRHLQHMGFLSCTGVDNPTRTLVTWQGLQPQAGYRGVEHGHGLVTQAATPWSTVTVLITTQIKYGSMSPINYMHKYYQTVFNTNSTSDNY